MAKECSICMENIYSETNLVITECKHSFHTSCLMKNVCFNGFACPYCRCKMADNSGEMTDNLGEVGDNLGEIEVGEEVLPSSEFITKKLVDQGITVGQLVKCLLPQFQEYNNINYEQEQVEIFNKINALITNYSPEQEENMICDCGSICRMCSN
jgi:hypothetical protein